MADNYLEKQMERYRETRTFVRQSNPPLDLLLRRLSVQKGPLQTDYVVKEAQLQAILRSARILFGTSFDAVLSEKEQSITVEFKGQDLPVEVVGGVLLTMRLKAAELKLETSVDAADASGKAVIHLWRPA